ncbi:hypothetical protein [Kordia sp.]|uniref:hypothetical protein n=1 Tax=Kordia sp. TaxID=1965332 RepID=UPI003B597550
MKKSIYILVLVLTSTLISCNSSQPTPEELVGKDTFELLQKMETISKDDFNTYFISLEELREFAKDTTIKDAFRNAITNVSKDIHLIRLQQSYDMIKESGTRYEIDWKNIKFREYLYQTREESGITFHDGFVAFDDQDKKFVAKIVSINCKGKQRLFNLSNVEPVRKQ